MKLQSWRGKKRDTYLAWGSGCGPGKGRQGGEVGAMKGHHTLAGASGYRLMEKRSLRAGRPQRLPTL